MGVNTYAPSIHSLSSFLPHSFTHPLSHLLSNSREGEEEAEAESGKKLRGENRGDRKGKIFIVSLRGKRRREGHDSR